MALLLLSYLERRRLKPYPPEVKHYKHSQRSTRFPLTLLPVYIYICMLRLSAKWWCSCNTGYSCCRQGNCRAQIQLSGVTTFCFNGCRRLSQHSVAVIRLIIALLSFSVCSFNSNPIRDRRRLPRVVCNKSPDVDDIIVQDQHNSSKK